jgi:hypothetical protein
MNIYSLIVSLFFVPNGTNICSCAPNGKWRIETPKEYNYVDDVFIGDVKEIGESKFDYEIVVCEVFKGNLKAGQVVKGTNPRSCSPFVDKLGEWVFFGKYSTDFKTNDCGMSSNIAEPFGMFPPPPPPKPNTDIDGKELKKKWKAESRKSILEQITMLRNMSE